LKSEKAAQNFAGISNNVLVGGMKAQHPQARDRRKTLGPVVKNPLSRPDEAFAHQRIRKKGARCRVVSAAPEIVPARPLPYP